MFCGETRQLALSKREPKEVGGGGERRGRDKKGGGKKADSIPVAMMMRIAYVSASGQPGLVPSRLTATGVAAGCFVSSVRVEMERGC